MGADAATAAQLRVTRSEALVPMDHVRKAHQWWLGSWAGAVYRLLSFHRNKHTGHRRTWKFPLLGQMSRRLGTLLSLSRWNGADNLRWTWKHQEIGRWLKSSPGLNCNLWDRWMRRHQGAGCTVLQGGPLDSNCGVSPSLSFCPSSLQRYRTVTQWHTRQGSCGADVSFQVYPP